MYYQVNHVVVGIRFCGHRVPVKPYAGQSDYCSWMKSRICCLECSPVFVYTWRMCSCTVPGVMNSSEAIFFCVCPCAYSEITSVSRSESWYCFLSAAMPAANESSRNEAMALCSSGLLRATAF